MKYFLLTVLFISTAAFGVELSDATDEQILSELRGRLQGGGGSSEILIDYSCSYYNGLMMNIYDGSGSSFSRSVSNGYTGNGEGCERSLVSLNRHRGRINGQAFIAVCLKPNGLKLVKARVSGTTVQRISVVAMDSLDECLEAADQINRQ